MWRFLLVIALHWFAMAVLASVDGQTGWFLPDDELKHLEHPDDAAHRILSEQLGLSDLPVSLNHIESFKGNDSSWHLVFHFTSVLETPASVDPAGEMISFEWFPLTRLPDRAEVAHHGWAIDVIQSIIDSQTAGDRN